MVASSMWYEVLRRKNVLDEPREMERVQLGLIRGRKSERGVDPNR